MRVRLLVTLCSALVVCGALIAVGTASAGPSPLTEHLAATRGRASGGPSRLPAHLKARYLSFPVRGVSRAQALRQSAAGTTVPLWSHKATALGTGYTYQMVGKNPFVKLKTQSVSVPTDVMPIKIEFLNSSNAVEYTFDPNATNTACGLSTSTDLRTRQSPLFNAFNDVVGGTNVGTVQYESGFMRENFAKKVLGSGALNPNYGITLKAVNSPEWTVQFPAGDWAIDPASSSGACGGSAGGNLGLINIQVWDPFVQQTLIPDLQAAGDTTSTKMLDLLFANVVMYSGSTSNCCILGYHSGVSTTPGVQYYDTSDYDSTGLFASSPDINGMSHELGEWINDPNANNPTPAWGHIGQVSGCQSNLEVGDPLTGTNVPITMPNGLTYHPQELAFLSWFYRQVPSIGLNGWYSSQGTFTQDAGGVCS